MQGIFRTACYWRNGKPQLYDRVRAGFLLTAAWPAVFLLGDGTSSHSQKLCIFFLAVEYTCYEKGALAMATATIKKCHLRMNNCAVVTFKFWFSHWRSRFQLKSPACAADWIKHCCRLKLWSSLQKKIYVTSKLCKKTNKKLLNIKNTKNLATPGCTQFSTKTTNAVISLCCFTEDGALATSATRLSFVSIIHF